jgi:hypothetical protein
MRATPFKNCFLRRPSAHSADRPTAKRTIIGGSGTPVGPPPVPPPEVDVDAVPTRAKAPCELPATTGTHPVLPCMNCVTPPALLAQFQIASVPAPPAEPTSQYETPLVSETLLAGVSVWIAHVPAVHCVGPKSGKLVTSPRADNSVPGLPAVVVNKAKLTPFAALVGTPVIFPSATSTALTLRLAVGVNSSANSAPGIISHPVVVLNAFPAPRSERTIESALAEFTQQKLRSDSNIRPGPALHAICLRFIFLPFRVDPLDIGVMLPHIWRGDYFAL